MRRTIPVLTATLGLAILAACAADPPQAGGTATPTGVPSASPAGVPSASPTAAPSAKPPAPPRATRSPAPLVLGPTALGKLEIGMSAAEANATGMIAPLLPRDPTGCAAAELLPRGSEHTVTYSSRRGVISIPAWGRMSTPEGIRVGSTQAQVRQAYDDFRMHAADAPASGRGFAGFDDGNNAHYRFSIDNRRVVELWIEHDEQDCYE